MILGPVFGILWQRFSQKRVFLRHKMAVWLETLILWQGDEEAGGYSTKPRVATLTVKWSWSRRTHSERVAPVVSTSSTSRM